MSLSLRAWPLVPLVLVLEALAAWVVVHTGTRQRVLVSVTAFTVVWLAGTSIAVWFAPDAGLFRIGIGPPVTLVGAGVLAGGVALISLRESGCPAAS